MRILKLVELEGMTSDLAVALEAAGIADAAALLAAAGSKEGREALAARLGVEARKLLELCNRADLSRIKGIGTVYSDLLEFAGVDTVMELAQRNADNLYAKIVEEAGAHHVKRTPTATDVANWVGQAQALERKVFH